MTARRALVAADAVVAPALLLAGLWRVAWLSQWAVAAVVLALLAVYPATSFALSLYSRPAAGHNPSHPLAAGRVHHAQPAAATAAEAGCSNSRNGTAAIFDGHAATSPAGRGVPAVVHGRFAAAGAPIALTP
jgi:hypothetical protein